MKNQSLPSVLEFDVPIRNRNIPSIDLQKLLDSSLDVICSIDKEGRFIYVNAAAKDVWGYDPQFLYGKYYIDFVIEEDRPLTNTAAHNIMSGINTTNFKNRYRYSDGSIKHILWSARWDQKEKIMYCVAKDVTERIEAEARSRLQEQRLHRAYKLAQIAWWELNIATGIYTCSDEIFNIYGLPIPENNQLTLEEFLQLVHPEDVEKLRHDIVNLCDDTYFNYEHRVVKPSGEVIYMIHYSELIRDAAGNPIALHGTAKNITQRKLHQIELEISKNKLQAYSQKLFDILESIGDAFFTVDREWQVTYWNKQAESILKLPREEVLGKNLWEHFKEAVHLKFYSEYHRSVSENIPVHFEEFFQPLNIWVEVDAYPSNEGLTVYFKDITDKKEQEIRQKISNERYEFVSKATSDAIWDWDITNNTNYFNDAFTHLFGYSNESQSISDSWSDHIYERDRKKTIKDVEDALQDPTRHSWEGEYRFIKSDGSLSYVYDRGIIIRNPEGKAIRMVGSMQDITKIKEAEKEISKAIINTQEKERSEIGKELHDNVNQILTTIKLYIENIRDYPEHSASFIEKGAQLSQRAINEIRFLAKQLVTPVMADLGFKATLDELVDHYKALNLFEIQFLFNIDEQQIDKGLQLTLYRIIQEQLNNVVKYAKASVVKIQLVSEEENLLVVIKDNGIGFDSSKASHGLGLRNIKHRAEVFKGLVHLNTNVGEGCSLIITFPFD